MTDHSHGGARPPSRKTWWIAGLLALLLVALVVWFMSRTGQDDNLVPEAVAVDPNTGNMTATGTAALDATGTDTGQPATPGVFNEDSAGGGAARTPDQSVSNVAPGLAAPGQPAAATGAAGAAAPGAPTTTPPQQ